MLTFGMTIIQNISLISFQLKYLYHGFQRPLEKRTNGTSGSVRHPVVLHIQSEANIVILGYSVIGQILTGDPHFHNTMFWLHFKWLREAATYGDTLYD